MPSTKKYKLFSIREGKKPPCAFYFSATGCKNGDKCAFLHEQEGERAMEVSDSTSIISSESEGDDHRIPKNRPVSHSKAISQRGTDLDREDGTKKKRKSVSAQDDPFASPMRKNVTIGNGSHSCSQKKKPRRTLTTKKEVEVEYRSFASHLPVTSFSMMSTNNGAKNAGIASPPTKFCNPEKASYSLPLPKSTESGRKWKSAVLRTQKHERYDGSFDFANYKQKCKEAGIQSDWIKARKFGTWCSSNPQVVAIDCELCETQDPVSGSKNSKALCRISVVNAEHPDEVLLDTLVKPSWPIKDYRTSINGIQKKHLENVQFTLRHAQAFMMALCSDETVIVGHAVHNDLVALNMDHHCIADSSFLFHAKDSISTIVSLKDLVSNIFNEKMPETRDSVNDARKALDCVNHWVKNSGKVAEIEWGNTTLKNAQLFVNRIPMYCKNQNLSSMFQKYTDILPQEIDEIEFSGNTGKTHVTFRTSRHANLAFDTIDGSSEHDESGMLQKKVYLRDGDYIQIRKMVQSRGDGMSFGL